jgi:hypothetical protein
MWGWTRTDTTTTTETTTHIPPPPPLHPPAPAPAPAPVQLPSPPTTPIRATRPPRPRPAETPPAPVDFSAVPVGQQEYGAYTIGGRRAPVHASQKKQAANYLKSPVTPGTPAPTVRLGGAIQPNSPSPRPTTSPAVTVPMGDLRSGLRRTGGPRRSIPSRADSDDGSELRAQLARRRTWEPRDETASTFSNTSRSPTGSDVSRTSNVRELPSVSEFQ